MTKATCQTEGCDRSPIARGLCRPCYARFHRSDRFEPAAPKLVHSLTDVDEKAATATCAICGPVSIRIKRRRYRSIECATASRQYDRLRRVRDPRKRRASRIKRYGLTVEDVAAMAADQRGACAICSRPESLAIDHDHGSGAVRGLLCRACNLALGLLEDDIERLLAAAAYLRNHADRAGSVTELQRSSM